jgi:cell division protein FtsB
VGRIALLLVLGVILLLYVSPVRNWITQSGTAEQHQRELRALEREHTELERRVRELRRPDAVEREARRLGMIKKGERAYVIENVPAERR